MRISDWSSDVCSSDLRDTAYVADRETAEGVEIETAAGHVLQAKAAVFATNSPVNDRIAIHTKQLPMRTYAIAGPVPARSAPDALLWDSLEAYHYVRLPPHDAETDLPIVRGANHREERKRARTERKA